MIADRSLGDNSKSAGYHFYETTKGYQFRSWESLCVDSNGELRPPKQTFEYRPANVGKKGPSGKDANDIANNVVKHDVMHVRERCCQRSEKCFAV